MPSPWGRTEQQNEPNLCLYDLIQTYVCLALADGINVPVNHKFVSFIKVLWPGWQFVSNLKLEVGVNQVESSQCDCGLTLSSKSFLLILDHISNRGQCLVDDGKLSLT